MPLNLPDSNRIVGYLLCAFILWLMIALGAAVTWAVYPENLARFGEYGDAFGVFNSGLGIATALAAILALRQQADEIDEQKKNFSMQLTSERERFAKTLEHEQQVLLDQQDQARKMLLRQKLEALLERLMLSVVESANICTAVDNNLTEQVLRDSLTSMASDGLALRVIQSIYFPGLKGILIIPNQHYAYLADAWMLYHKSQDISDNQKQEIIYVVKSRHAYISNLASAISNKVDEIINSPEKEVEIQGGCLHPIISDMLNKRYGSATYTFNAPSEPM